jgi:TolA-binding protein/anti-sigma factor RsiW
MRADCDRRWEIDALREGTLGAKDAEAFERHARTCDVCAATLARDARLRELATSLAANAPNELHLRRLRARVLHDVATGSPERRHLMVPLVAALALTLLGLASWALVRRGVIPSSVPHAILPQPALPALPALPSSAAARSAVIAEDAFAAAVLPGEGARWSRVREGLVERVRLEDGTLKIHVRHQASGERFLVELPDGELEVRGTTFEVTVRAFKTERVSVDEGVVAVRVKAAGAERELRAGEAWDAPRSGALAKGSGLTPRAGVRRGAHAAAPASEAAPASANVAPDVDDGAEAYAAAMARMQGGQYSLAASGFHAFVLAHPGAPQAEDASFLEAASLARAGRPDAAALAAEDHLARFPKSFHHKEAAILVARAARDRGDCAQARAAVAPWLGSPADDAVQAALKKCAADVTSGAPSP